MRYKPQEVMPVGQIDLLLYYTIPQRVSEIVLESGGVLELPYAKEDIKEDLTVHILFMRDKMICCVRTTTWRFHCDFILDGKDEAYFLTKYVLEAV